MIVIVSVVIFIIVIIIIIFVIIVVVYSPADGLPGALVAGAAGGAAPGTRHPPSAPRPGDSFLEPLRRFFRTFEPLRTPNNPYRRGS